MIIGENILEIVNRITQAYKLSVLKVIPNFRRNYIHSNLFLPSTNVYIIRNSKYYFDLFFESNSVESRIERKFETIIFELF